MGSSGEEKVTKTLSLRALTLADAELVFEWRNEPYIVRLGSLNKTVSWEEHKSWITNTVDNLNRKAYILEVNGTPAGQIRFDLITIDSCYLSVYLIADFSGKGLGVDFIKMGCVQIFEEWKTLKKIIALVRLENKIGQKAFTKAGFIADESELEAHHAAFSIERK